MQAALEYITQQHPAFGPLIARAAPPPAPTPLTEPYAAPYAALVRAIAHQQLHGNAARAILARFTALYPETPFPTPAQILATADPALRACGFSATKVASIRDICQHAADGMVPTAAEAANIDDETLITRLTAIRGVGRWTVEMVLISTLNRPDILPVDDFGIRDGWRRLNGLDAPPKPKALAAIGTAWSPHRSTAAWYLWRASDEGKPVKP